MFRPDKTFQNQKNVEWCSYVSAVRGCFDFALDFDALSHQSTRSLEAVPACAADGKNLKNLGQNYKPMKPC